MADKIRVLEKRPGEKPRVREIDNNLDVMQEIVDGYIQVVYPFKDRVGLVCNEDGKLIGLAPNILLKSGGRAYDFVCGTLLLCGLGGEDFEDMPEGLIDKYEKLLNRWAFKSLNFC